jgi:predicted dehydrogenase
LGPGSCYNSKTVWRLEDEPVNRITWGFIGCGDVTEVKSGPAFQEIDHSQVAAVMCRDAPKARDYAARHRIPGWTTDANALINDPEINAVYVATPPSSHCKYTVMAARAGKHIYVEKPMAVNFQECRQMIQAARKAGVGLFVAYYRRALPYFNKVKELLTEGAIGQTRLVSLRLHRPLPQEPFPQGRLPWRFDPGISGGGLFVDLGCHQLDLLDYLFGPVDRVCGQATNQAGLYPAEDIVSASFVFASGVVGSGTWCFTAPAHDRTDTIEITGSRGTIRFGTFNFTPICLETRQGVETFEYEIPPHIQEPLIRSVVDHLRKQAECPSTGITAARTTHVMDKILKNDY